MIKRVFCLSIAITLAVGAQPGMPGASGAKTTSVKEMLVIGQPGLRLHSLAMITQGNIPDEVDETYLPGFTVCAADKTLPVRSITAQLLGKHFVEGKEHPNEEAVALLMQLAKDPVSDVSYKAVYYGLSHIQSKSPEVIELLIDVVSENREQELYDRVIASLVEDREQVIQILNKKLQGEDAIAFYEIYEDLAGVAPVGAEKYLEEPSSRPMLFVFKGSDEGMSAEEAVLALTELVESVGVESPHIQVSNMGDSYVLMLKTYLTKDRLLVEEKLENQEAFLLTQSMWLTPELEIQLEPAP